jgi:hypothetical protein
MAWSGVSAPAKQQTLSMSIRGDAASAVDDILRNCQDLRDAWTLFYRPAFYRAMEDTFKGNQDGSWRPLNKRYKKWKAAHGGSPYLMNMTGDLKASLTGDTSESFYQPLPRSMEIGGAPVNPGKWNSPNTPKGRMIIYAHSSYMGREMSEAAQQHLDWYARKWGGLRGV